MSNNKFGLRTRLGLIKEISQTTQSDSSCGWQRPAEWLDLPVNTDVNKKVFYGLFLVFEDEFNALRISVNNGVSGGGNTIVDWGDGTPSFTFSSPITKIYDYDSITGAVNQYYDGRNYKQVIVSIDNFNSNAFSIAATDSTNNINTNSSLNFADIYVSYGMMTSNSSFVINGSRTLPYLEIFKFENATLTGSFSLNRASILQIVEFNNVNLVRVLSLVNTKINQPFDFPPVRTSNNSNQNLIIDSIDSYVMANMQTTDGIFRYIKCRKINSFTANSVGTSFEGRNFARDAYYLEEIGLIDAPFTRYDYGFNNCVSLRKVTFQDFSTVTNTLNMFLTTGNIRELILSGCTVGVDISSNSMTADALDAMFTSLGTASGVQTITITDNPGTATCDTTIATGKGYTVVV